MCSCVSVDHKKKDREGEGQKQRQRLEMRDRVLVHVCDTNMTGSSVTNGLLKCSP